MMKLGQSGHELHHYACCILVPVNLHDSRRVQAVEGSLRQLSLHVEPELLPRLHAEVVLANELLERLRLQWETVREGRLMRPRYGILELDQIRAREYVVPDFSKGDGYFHSSIFKWHRGSPDKEGFSTNGAPLTDDDNSDEERE